MTRTLAESNRYHYQEFRSFYSALAASEKFDADSILVGSGSTEILHCAIDAFTSEKRPFITSWPTYEAGPELAATKGAPVVKLTAHLELWIRREESWPKKPRKRAAG
jgi:histidinol-phosphate/aromatic aminotransferase/cobyric acid decarboxylase-like protein